MELISQGIQSYQKHQTHAGWVAQSEQSSGIGQNSETEFNPKDDRVSLSGAKDIYNWLAQEFPHGHSAADNIIRLNQQLFDYQIFSLEDMETMNHLLADSAPEKLEHTIEHHLAETASYQKRQHLNHIQRVYATLEASRQLQA